MKFNALEYGNTVRLEMSNTFCVCYKVKKYPCLVQGYYNYIKLTTASLHIHRIKYSINQQVILAWLHKTESNISII